MKKIIGIVFILLFIIQGKINAQKATVHIVAPGFFEDVNVFDPAVNYDPGKSFSTIHLDKNRSGALIVDFSEPQYAEKSQVLNIRSDKNGTGPEPVDISKPRYVKFWFSDTQYILFLSPGDDLTFKAEFKGNKQTLTVTGRGSNNNQPMIFGLTGIGLQQFRFDKTPDRTIFAIKKQEAHNAIVLQQYINHYKPSADFIRCAQQNIEYFALSKYYSFYHDYVYNPLESNKYDKWQKVEDSLMMKHKLNNESAVGSVNYDDLVDKFSFRNTESLIFKERRERPVDFYRQWYHTTVNKGSKIYAFEEHNLFYERVINKYFSGKSLELAYAKVLLWQFAFSNYKNIDLMFAHFVHKFPNSSYIPIFRNAMAEVVAKQKQTLNNNMVFVTDNGTKLNTLEEVARLMKGKTVFVDMWGTWCSSCRKELEKYSPKIRAHFKGKNLTFLYIASDDLNRQKEWKRVIAFYNMEGLHMLANEQLDHDIMTKVKSTGYPTYFIIKKDGSFKKAKTPDESHVQDMIKEIEAAM